MCQMIQEDPKRGGGACVTCTAPPERVLMLQTVGSFENQNAYTVSADMALAFVAEGLAQRIDSPHASVPALTKVMKRGQVLKGGLD